MCGIIGLINYDNNQKYDLSVRKLLSDMMITGTLRGKDSTGIMTVPRNIKEPVHIFKTTAEGYNVIHNPQFTAYAMSYESHKFFVAHHRAATIGKIKASNAHPFQHEGEHGIITLVHNGSLNNKYILKDHTKFDTDSEAVCYSFAHEGVEETLKKIRGAFCFVWHDSRNDSLNFVRNNGRPMGFAMLKDQSGMLFTSEIEMLKFLTARRNIGILEYYTLPVGKWMSFKSKNSKAVETNEVEFAPKEWYGDGNWHGYHNNNNYGSDGYWETINGKRRWVQTNKKALPDNSLQTKSKKGKKKKGKKNNKDHELAEYRKYRDKEVIAFVTCVETYSEPKHGTPVKRVEATMMEAPFHDIYWYTSNINGVSEGDDVVCTIRGYIPQKEDGSDSFTLVTNEMMVIDTQVTGQSDLDSFVRGPNNIHISVSEFEKLTAKGCQGCGANIEAMQADFITWTQDKTALCPKCSNEYYNSSAITH